MRSESESNPGAPHILCFSINNILSKYLLSNSLHHGSVPFPSQSCSRIETGNENCNGNGNLQPENRSRSKNSNSTQLFRSSLYLSLSSNNNFSLLCILTLALASLLFLLFKYSQLSSQLFKLCSFSLVES